MLYKEYPILTKNKDGSLIVNLKCNESDTFLLKISELSNELLNKLLEVDQEKRVSFEQLFDIFGTKETYNTENSVIT